MSISYHIKFVYHDELEPQIPQIRRYKASSPGDAFKKCLCEFPGARLIEGWREGGYLDGHGITTYKPPSLVKVKAKPAPKEEQMTLHL
jgi:hypothetical protein